jgi:hypothetical protein
MSSRYGFVVSDPIGRPSRKKLTATTRLPRSARAAAASSAGLVRRSGPRNSTLGAFPAAGSAAGGSDDSLQPAKASEASVAATSQIRVRFGSATLSTE